ncbi:hypothetical protein RDI58_006729 [Solanum bulbocastanum]|uniref:Uncharacterized protein n=1 Tax=Solanum bulbocastanum TaxID=147425 RepID=A0AAN8TXD8_SOLBU
MLILPQKQIYMGTLRLLMLCLTSGANIDVVGISITTQVKLKDADVEELKQSEGKHAKFVCDMCKFYHDWHVKSDGVYGNICVLILFLDDRQCFLNHFLAYIS